MSQPILSVRDLTIDLPPGSDRPHAVEGLGFDLYANEILCLVGESGSGKSLTAAAMMGLLPPYVRPSAGQMMFEDRDLLTLSEEGWRALRGRRFGMIFQEPMTALNPVMRVEDQILEVLTAHGERGGPERVMDLLHAVNLPDPMRLKSAYPHHLSGGQRQRVMIAMALALHPTVLIADEPTTALDVTTQAQILALIRQLQSERQMGVLFITHDFGVVAEIADRVAVLQHGRIVELGTKDQVLNDPQHEYTRRLIAAVPSLDPPERRSLERAPTMLSVKSLNKTYRTGGGLFRGRRVVHAAKNVTLSIRKGETLGLVGESGSGKTTVGRCLVRLIEPDSGRMDFRGVDLNAFNGRQLRPFRKKIQMIFQDPFASLNPRHKVGDIVAAGPIAFGATRLEAQKRSHDLLRLVGLEPSAADRYPHEFSGGQRQRIGIARALALDPELLIADEPVSALDVSVQAQVLELLADIKRRMNLSMLFITHDLRVAAQVCDRVAVMYQGEIVEQGLTADLFREPNHPYTRALLDAIPGKNWRVGRTR
jgi:ABC-type glutathione transport system ATPase component